MSHLCYCSAAFGNWGIVRMGTLVPECHMLFVCPYACGRHNSIGALRHGYKDRISYLFVESQDLAVGSIDNDLASAVDQILRELPHRPHVFLIYFSCVLYMIGFDWDAAIDELSEKYPDIAFRPCMMNPIAADKKTAGPRNDENTVLSVGAEPRENEEYQPPGQLYFPGRKPRAAPPAAGGRRPRAAAFSGRGGISGIRNGYIIFITSAKTYVPIIACLILLISENQTHFNEKTLSPIIKKSLVLALR